MKVVKSATELLNEEEIIERTKKKTVLARATRFEKISDFFQFLRRIVHFFCDFLMNFFPDFAPNSSEE